MMSDEHGQPERATGAQGAEDLADGASPNGSQSGYSALAGWAATDSDSASAGTRAGSGFTAATGQPAGPEYPGASGDYVGRHGTSGGPGQGPPDDEHDGDDPAEAEAKPRRRMSGWVELPVLVVVALTIALVIKTFVVQPFFIPSSSMENTLMVGDKVLVNKLVYHFRSIQPGDIIVFNGDGSWNANPPSSAPSSNLLARGYDDTLGALFSSIKGLLGTPLDQTDYIKRVIGVPGDRVKCCNAQGLVTVNGVALHEQSYVHPGEAPSQIRFNRVVPPGRLWVMGDNRAVSYDSRLRQSDPGFGTIPENKVIGRAFVVIWPPSHWKFLSIPATFGQPGINKTSSAAAGPAASATAVNQILGAQVRPEGPYLPLAAGVAGAVPLTWLERRVRRRLADRLRRRRLDRHS